MKNLVTLNFKYIMEGREKDRPTAMDVFVFDLISAAKKLSENNTSFASPEAYEDYIDDLVSDCLEGEYMIGLIDDVAFNLKEGGDEDEIYLNLHRRVDNAYIKVKEIFKKVKDELEWEFGND